MVNTSAMKVLFPDSMSMEDRELILQATKAEKVSLNFYLTPEAVEIIERARELYKTDKTKALEIVLREYARLLKKERR